MHSPGVDFALWAYPSVWGLLRRPLLWRQSIPDTAVLALLLYALCALLPRVAPDRASELWTLNQITTARSTVDMLLLLVCALLLRRQLSYPIGDQTWRVHAAVWLLNFSMASVLLGAGIVYKVALDLRLAAVLPVAEVERMKSLHEKYNYWTCLENIDMAALERHGATLERDLAVFGLRTDRTVIYPALDGELQCPLGKGSMLVLMLLASRPTDIKARRAWSVSLPAADADNMLFIGRLQGLAEVQHRTGNLGNEVLLALRDMLAQALAIATVLGAVGMHPSQRYRWRPLQRVSDWCRRRPTEGLLVRVTGLAPAERWLLMRAPRVWTIAPHRMLLGLLVAALAARVVFTNDVLVFFAGAFIVGLASILRQSRYRLRTSKVLFWPGYAFLMLVLCWPTTLCPTLSPPSTEHLARYLSSLICFLVVPLTVAAILAHALDMLWATTAWIAGLLTDILVLSFRDTLDEASIAAAWAAMAGLVVVAAAFGQAHRDWARLAATTVVACCCGASFAVPNTVLRWYREDDTLNADALVGIALLGVALAASASVYVLNHGRSWPSRE